MIFFRELSVEGFRGISNSLTFDLSAPLTVVYAPNGVGKTSLCDAAEWLMTDSVKRILTAGGSDADYRCAHTPSAMETRVSASVEIDREPLELSRSFTGCSWRRGNLSAQPVSSSELLATLAPSAAEPGVHALHANNSRQIWLRGTRFLSGDSLSTLLDSDEASVIVRQRLFADLLGVGHLLETERQLENYIKALRPMLKEKQTLYINTQSMLEEQQNDVVAQLDGDRRDLLSRAARMIEDAYALLDVPEDHIASFRLKELEIDRELSVVKSEHVKLKSLWDERRRAEIQIEADWGIRYSLANQLEADQNTSQNWAKTIDDIVIRSEAIRAVTGPIEAQLTFEKDKLATVQARLRVASSFAFARPRLNAYLHLSGLSQLSASQAFALTEDYHSENEADAAVARLRVLRTRSESRKNADDRELAEVNRELQRLQALNPAHDETDTISTRLSNADQDVRRLRLDYARKSQPFDELRRVASLIARQLSHEIHCPACNHNWGSSEELSQALLNTSRMVPDEVLELGRLLQEAEQLKTSLESQYASERALHEALSRARMRFNSLQAEKSQFDTLLAQEGLDITVPPSQSIELAITRILFVKAILTLKKDIYARLSLVSIPSFDENLTDFVDSYTQTLEREAVELSLSCESLEQRLSPRTEELSQLSQQLKGAGNELAILKARTEITSAHLQQLKTAWSLIANDLPWTDEYLAQISGSLRMEGERLARGGRLIEQAEHLTKVSSRLEVAERLRSSLNAIAAEQDRLNTYVKAAASAQDAYRQTRLSHVSAQMEKLVRVISPLFNRMQANQVYDTITGGDAATPLTWKAISDNFAMEPDTRFSQGQKQDFAMSIFLARARGLGGTFFLDEPLTHLDDLNRVALLDVFRAICLEAFGQLSIVITTASKPLVRHITEKFAPLDDDSSRPKPLLRVIELDGNPRMGVRIISA